jgi:hypothetical protein
MRSFTGGYAAVFFNAKFPGFATDVHGLIVVDGECFVDCVR